MDKHTDSPHAPRDPRDHSPAETNEPAHVHLRRVYPVSPEKVWAAWTDAQALSLWFGAGKPGSVSVAEFDLQVGGRYRIAFTCPKGLAHEVSGVYQELQPPHRLVFSWAWLSTPERVSRISISLRPCAEGTEMNFVHDRFFDDQARRNHEGGWAAMFEQLDTAMQRETHGETA